MEILASRMLIRPADYERSLAFYRDEIGLAIWREYGAGTVFFAGQSLIELAGHGRDDDVTGTFPAAALPGLVRVEEEDLDVGVGVQSTSTAM